MALDEVDGRPELTTELIDKIAAQSDAQAGGLSVRELERRRDDNLVAILQALRAQRDAAGEVLHEHDARLFAAGRVGLTSPPDLPLALYETTVDPAWLDYNGHMTEARYGEVFGYATDAFLRHVGLDAAYLAGGHSAYTVEGHIRYLREAERVRSARGTHTGRRSRHQAAAPVPRAHRSARRRDARDGRVHAPARRHERGEGVRGSSRSPNASPPRRLPTRSCRSRTAPVVRSAD